MRLTSHPLQASLPPPAAMLSKLVMHNFEFHQFRCAEDGGTRAAYSAENHLLA